MLTGCERERRQDVVSSTTRCAPAAMQPLLRSIVLKEVSKPFSDNEEKEPVNPVREREGEGGGGGGVCVFSLEKKTLLCIAGVEMSFLSAVAGPVRVQRSPQTDVQSEPGHFAHPLLLPPSPFLPPPHLLTVVDEVLEDLFAAGLHSVVQQRAAGGVLQQEVRPLLVELHQLHAWTQTDSE